MELQPPGAVAFDDAAVAVGDALTTRARAERVRQRNYYDTFDGLLRSRGLQLTHEDGELVLREAHGSDAARARLTAARPRRPLLVSSLPAGPLRDALSELVGVRALLLLARVRWRER